MSHKKDGMECLLKRKCDAEGCGRSAQFAMPGEKARCCDVHQTKGMVLVRPKKPRATQAEMKANNHALLHAESQNGISSATATATPATPSSASDNSDDATSTTASASAAVPASQSGDGAPAGPESSKQAKSGSEGNDPGDEEEDEAAAERCSEDERVESPTPTPDAEGDTTEDEEDVVDAPYKRRRIDEGVTSEAGIENSDGVVAVAVSAVAETTAAAATTTTTAPSTTECVDDSRDERQSVSGEEGPRSDGVQESGLSGSLSSVSATATTTPTTLVTSKAVRAGARLPSENKTVTADGAARPGGTRRELHQIAPQPSPPPLPLPLPLPLPPRLTPMSLQGYNFLQGVGLSATGGGGGGLQLAALLQQHHPGLYFSPGVQHRLAGASLLPMQAGGLPFIGASINNNNNAWVGDASQRQVGVLPPRDNAGAGGGGAFDNNFISR